jgi:DNA end-binding protein Ku
MFFDKPYYLEPQKAGAKAYSLLREALKKSGKVGIAKVVIKTRQHLATIKPEEKALVLELMHFSEELIEPGSLQIPGPSELGKGELDMATELIGRMSSHWQPEKFKDEYRHALTELIQKKVEAGDKRAVSTAAAKQRSPTKVIDLVSVLQESLKAASKKGSAPKTAASKRKTHLKKAA